jgi:RNase P protein component
MKTQSRWHSLTDTRNYSAALKTKPLRFGFFEIYRTQPIDGSIRKIGFIFSKKNIPLSVLRSKLKKFTHETIRKLILSSNFAIIIKVKSLITKKNFEQQKLILLSGLNHLNTGL